MHRAILHFDGDSFFASVEQVMNHTLRGKPIVTGGERGAITSVSVEGKRLGVNRGMTLRHARTVAPGLIVVPSDYMSYSIFARRMYGIVRRFTSEIEEYSIDECFADITGLDEVYRMSYEDIALMIKNRLEASLGLTFGVGLGPNKVLAKVASKHRKPGGFTPIWKNAARGQTEIIADFLREMSVGKIWGIGSSTSVALGKLGIRTALDFASKSEAWLAYHHIAKPYREIWLELNGESVKPLSVRWHGPTADAPDAPDDAVGSIIKSRTFSPPSTDRSYIFSQLSKNTEEACIRVRHHGMKARHMRFYLKTQAFTYMSFETSFTVPLSAPGDILKIVAKHFDETYRPGVLYRATGISLSGFISEDRISSDLFGESIRTEKGSAVFAVVDTMSRKYGKHTLFLGSSMRALEKAGLVASRDRRAVREELILAGDRRKKTIDIPFLGKVR